MNERTELARIRQTLERVVNYMDKAETGPLERRIGKLEDWATARNGDIERRLEALERGALNVYPPPLVDRSGSAAERFRAGRHKQVRGVTVVVDDTAQADAAHALDELREALRDMVKAHRERADEARTWRSCGHSVGNTWDEAANLLAEALGDEAAP
jgi:hypothetical protein